MSYWLDISYISELNFLICAVSATALLFCTVPTISNILYVIVMLAAINSNVNTTAAVDFYPTQIRWVEFSIRILGEISNLFRSTAISITLIFGRLGGIIGSYLVGLFYDIYCDLTFITSAIMFLTCALAPFFLPKKWFFWINKWNLGFKNR